MGKEADDEIWDARRPDIDLAIYSGSIRHRMGSLCGVTLGLEKAGHSAAAH